MRQTEPDDGTAAQAFIGEYAVTVTSGAVTAVEPLREGWAEVQPAAVPTITERVSCHGSAVTGQSRAVLAASIASGESTWVIAIEEAPSTPASTPALEEITRSDSVASGSDRR